MTLLIRHIGETRARVTISVAVSCAMTVAMSVLALALMAGLAIPQVPSSGAVGRPITTASNVRPLFLEHQMAPKAPTLPAATVPPAAAPSSVATAAPVSPHEVFGFLPYWSLDQSAEFSVAGLTTLDYFSVRIDPNGTLNESGAGWNGYESHALSTLITRAHGVGVRVVLTVNDFDQSSLDTLTSNPAAATTLSEALVSAVEAKNFDGVNLDLEGSGSADQAGLTRLVTTVSNALHQVDPHWQVTMDTYASSASGPGGFYDIAALASSVDAFFVMEYSPNVAAAAQANSPLTSSLFSDLTTIQQYAADVPPDKVILGVPLYGEEWPTTTNTLNATATGPVATLTDSEIEGAGKPIYWDPVTESAWTTNQVGTQWYETFFDDSTSIYQIALLADQYGLAGLGMWALSATGTAPAMVDALNAEPPAIHYATPPAATTPSSTTPPVPNVPTIAPPTNASGEPSGTPATSAVDGNSGQVPPSVSAASFTGAFEAESLASIEDDTPESTSPSPALQAVTLCLVASPTNDGAQCGTTDPSNANAPASPSVAPGLTPPSPGATVVGILSGITVTNDATLSCIETDNQLAELGPSMSDTLPPRLVVWQLPNDQRYYYVVMSSTPIGSGAADCTSATLAFPVPAQTTSLPG
jgi:spore germination protein YaaH